MHAYLSMCVYTYAYVCGCGYVYDDVNAYEYSCVYIYVCSFVRIHIRGPIYKCTAHTPAQTVQLKPFS